MDDKQVQFIPFNGINEFMLNDYRLHVIQQVLAGIDRLLGERRSAINSLVRRHVQVPGFRNSVQAPSGVKARACVTVRAPRRDDLATSSRVGPAAPRIRPQKSILPKAREWEILPPDADRPKLPGFMVVWPAVQTMTGWMRRSPR